MPPHPDETPAEHVAHILQYAQLATMALTNARRTYGKRNIMLSIQEENELLDYLTGIEERAKALTPAAGPPAPGLADATAPRLHFYDCTACLKPHWEDEQPTYDVHLAFRSASEIRYAHRSPLGLLR